MRDIIGVVWFKNETTYSRALSTFTDPEEMPSNYKEWKALVTRQCELIRGSANAVFRAEINPETFIDWCTSHGVPANSQGRTAFANHAVLEYQKTGKGTLIE